MRTNDRGRPPLRARSADERHHGYHGRAAPRPFRVDSDDDVRSRQDEIAASRYSHHRSDTREYDSDSERDRRRHKDLNERPTQYFPGDFVMARYRSRGEWRQAKVARVRDDCSYDIRYSDGELETKVDPIFLRLDQTDRHRGEERGRASTEHRARSRSPITLKLHLTTGDKVEARYRGRSKFYPGKISRDRGDGTFDVDYDDGEKETRVREDLIRSLEAARSPSRRDDSRDGRAPAHAHAHAHAALRAGDKVEARYRGREKWYKGKISRDRGDGTFDVDYDDGEKETRVREDLIRSLEAARSPSRRDDSLDGRAPAHAHAYAPPSRLENSHLVVAHQPTSVRGRTSSFG